MGGEPGNGRIGSVGSFSGGGEPGNGRNGSVGSFSGGGGNPGMVALEV